MKSNLDNIIQQKLGELDIKYDAKYWKDMEDKLKSSTSTGSTSIGASSGISSTYLIIIATIGIAALSVISFMLLSNNNQDDSLRDSIIIDNIVKPNTNKVEATRYSTIGKNDIINDKKKTSEETSINKNYKSSQHKANEESSKISTDNNSQSSIENNIKSNNVKHIVSKTETISTVKEKDIIMNTDSEINSINTVTNINDNNTRKEYTSETINIKSDSCKSSNYKKTTFSKHGSKEYQTKDKLKENSNLKNVTPIDKPAKRVFKKRKGNLWGLITWR